MRIGGSKQDLLDFYGDPDNPDPLDPELEAHLEKPRKGWVNLRHPLVYQIGYNPILNRMLNKQLHAKKAALAEARKDKKWSTYLMLHERPYRNYAFIEIMQELSNAEYWRLLGSIMIDTENMWQWERVLKRLLNSKRPRRELMMSEPERNLIQVAGGPGGNFPPIYRGYHRTSRKLGLSWTLDHELAVWFAKRLVIRKSDVPRVVHGQIAREDVIAYFEGRGEYEVIADPATVAIVKVERLTAPEPPSIVADP